MIKHNAFSITHRFTLKLTAKTCNIREKNQRNNAWYVEGY